MTTPKLELEDRTVDELTVTMIDGNSVKTGLSPFDIPQTAAASYDESNHVLHLLFEYKGGSEPTTVRTFEDGASLVIGKSSSRLYEITIPVIFTTPQIGTPDLSRNTVQTALRNAAQQVTKYRHNNPKVKSHSFEAIGTVFKLYEKQLEPLVTNALLASSS